jgi:hypothetical protein
MEFRWKIEIHKIENSAKTRHEAKPSEFSSVETVICQIFSAKIFYFALLLFDIQSCQPNRFYFPHKIGKIIHVNVFFHAHWILVVFCSSKIVSKDGN